MPTQRDADVPIQRDAEQTGALVLAGVALLMGLLREPKWLDGGLGRGRPGFPMPGANFFCDFP